MQDHAYEALDSFRAEGLITDVLRPLRSGKEASVYLCRANPAVAGTSLAAAKVYHARERRNFRNDAAYKDGERLGNARDRRAVAKKTRHGRGVEYGWWIWHEFEMLTRVRAAGADVPAPISLGESAILMEFVGAEDADAAQLRELRPSPAEASALFDRLLRNVELMLRANVVHADLSAYNVLCFDGEVRIIDFPQAVDARTNGHASEFLARDVSNLCRFFERFGVSRDPEALARDLWVSWTFATL